MSDLKTEMHQLRYQLGLHPRPLQTPDPAGGDYSAPQTTRGFKGPTSKGRERKEREGKGRGREGEWRAEEGGWPPFQIPEYATGYRDCSLH